MDAVPDPVLRPCLAGSLIKQVPGFEDEQLGNPLPVWLPRPAFYPSPFGVNCMPVDLLICPIAE
jgi:hypothetical protein